jgi:hypothetical protein
MAGHVYKNLTVQPVLFHRHISLLILNYFQHHQIKSNLAVFEYWYSFVFLFFDFCILSFLYTYCSLYIPVDNNTNIIDINACFTSQTSKDKDHKLFIKQAVRYLDIMNDLLHAFFSYLCIFIAIYIYKIYLFVFFCLPQMNSIKKKEGLSIMFLYNII